MWRLAFLGLVLTLSGCGYATWWNPPFNGGYNPNQPAGDSENMQRVRGQEPTVARLTTEPGDIWPGPLPPAPTLKELVGTEGLTSQPALPEPGSPLSRSSAAPLPSPNPSEGSSTPPLANVQPSSPTSNMRPPIPSYATPPAAPPGRGPGGQIVQMPGAPAVTTGGGPGYQTTTTPDGGQSIIVPNGNGTSTVIRSDGRVETVPTPK
jgi:hypothetical protein